MLDAARPLLATSAALAAPSPLFRAALPGLQLAKRIIDARALAHVERERYHGAVSEVDVEASTRPKTRRGTELASAVPSEN